jgi:hypothetical protein
MKIEIGKWYTTHAKTYMYVCEIISSKVYGITLAHGTLSVVAYSWLPLDLFKKYSVLSEDAYRYSRDCIEAIKW